VAPLKSLSIIQNLQVNLNRAAEYLARTAGKFFYFVTRETWIARPACTPACFSITAKTGNRPPPRAVRRPGWWRTALAKNQ